VRDRLPPLLASAAAVAAALALTPAVLAHGGETFINAEPTIVQPGGGIGVRADLLTSGPVTISLAGTDGSRREVGTVEETVEGHFEVFLEVPGDLPAGVWTLLAEADHTIYGSTTIEVAGPAVGAQEGGGQGPREEDDRLLVPLPSGWQASRSSPPATTTPPAALTDGVDLVPIVSLAAAIGGLALLARRTRGSPPEGADQPGR
jgi:hypothetical protein